MDHYDPEKPIDAAVWMALDEDKRQYLVEQYHRENRSKMSNLQIHAMFHVVAENQVALGDETPARKTLARLMREGLTRHEALHAIASVMASCLFDLMQQGSKGRDVNVEYFRQLEELTAEGWLNSFGEDSEE